LNPKSQYGIKPVISYSQIIQLEDKEMDGFYNKVLHINMSKRSFVEESIGDDVYQQYLGGKGLGTYLLMNNTKAGVDPLSEDNVLIFTIGPITDTMVWGSSRFAVFTKSPLTGFYTESLSLIHISEPTRPY